MDFTQTFRLLVLRDFQRSFELHTLNVQTIGLYTGLILQGGPKSKLGFRKNTEYAIKTVKRVNLIQSYIKVTAKYVIELFYCFTR